MKLLYWKFSEEVRYPGTLPIHESETFTYRPPLPQSIVPGCPLGLDLLHIHPSSGRLRTDSHPCPPLSTLTTNSSTWLIMSLLTAHKAFRVCGFRVLWSSRFPETVWMGGKFHNSVAYNLYISFSSVSFSWVYYVTLACDLSLLYN